MAKPVDVVRNHEKTIIQNDSLSLDMSQKKPYLDERNLKYLIGAKLVIVSD